MRVCVAGSAAPDLTAPTRILSSASAFLNSLRSMEPLPSASVRTEKTSVRRGDERPNVSCGQIQ